MFTDHQALVSSFLPYLKSQSKGLLARWYLRLAPYLPNLSLQYKPGAVNQATDALSCAPHGESLVLHISWEHYENDPGSPARGPAVTAIDGVP